MASASVPGRLGQAPELPPFHILDIMQMQTGVADDYNAFGIASLVAFLERATETPLDREALLSAVRLTNHRRTVLLKLDTSPAENALDVLRKEPAMEVVKAINLPALESPKQ